MKVFGTKKLKGYDQERLHAYLAERYLPFGSKNILVLQCVIGVIMILVKKNQKKFFKIN